jgi:hypothetical protein
LKSLLIAVFTLFLPLITAAINRDLAIEALVPLKNHPRILNADDVGLRNTNDTEFLLSPEGDFNQDTLPDVAISGRFDEPKLAKPYFLLVATQFVNPVRFEALYFKEFATPVYIYKPGTTGKSDPGDQAFAISICSNCSEGTDFYWNKKTDKFDLNPWRLRVEHEEKKVSVPSLDIPVDIVDASLKIAGDLPDVKAFVKNLKQTGGIVGTRVEVEKSRRKSNRYNVIIFEKKEGKENLYDTILVDVKSKKVIKRMKK